MLRTGKGSKSNSFKVVPLAFNVNMDGVIKVKMMMERIGEQDCMTSRMQ